MFDFVEKKSVGVMVRVCVCVLCVSVLCSVPVFGGISSSLTSTVCQRADSGCRCTTNAKGLVVECSKSGSSTFPMDLPSQAVKM